MAQAIHDPRAGVEIVSGSMNAAWQEYVAIGALAGVTHQLHWKLAIAVAAGALFCALAYTYTIQAPRGQIVRAWSYWAIALALLAVIIVRTF